MPSQNSPRKIGSKERKLHENPIFTFLSLSCCKTI